MTKLQRWSLYRGSLEATTNGPWVLATDIEELEKELVAWKTRSKNLHDTLEKESAKLRDEITSLRVQLGAIGELVKDRVNTALEMK
jgi:hypothetical protein